MSKCDDYRKVLELVRDWHDGDLDDGNWDKVISKVREVLGDRAELQPFPQENASE